jgi:hypothetical protein
LVLIILVAFHVVAVDEGFDALLEIWRLVGEEGESQWKFEGKVEVISPSLGTRVACRVH